MSNDDDDDYELPSAEELREAARPGIDCLVARWGLAIAVEVLQRLELDEEGRDNLALLKELLGKDMAIEGRFKPYHFSDDSLVELQQEAKRIVDALIQSE
jgi:hypothetical protein